MHCTGAALLVLLSLGLFIFGQGEETEDLERPKVSTQYGIIVGQTVNVLSSERGVNRFLGIPYAEAPIGKLRYRRPVPYSGKFQEPFQAVNWPPNCQQTFNTPFTNLALPLTLNQNVSEDCLYLNVWSPDLEISDETDLKPVLVWIHGGGLMFGTSSFKLYDGEVISKMADAVVVSFNYRLSGLGFLFSDEVEEVRGNQGLLDQVAALEWVQDNIRYFGGDPNLVTIMGQSAGSWSVSLHVLSPISRNLFQNAIMMSGAALTNNVVTYAEEYVQRFLTGIRKVGCASEEDQTISAKVIECLQELPPEKAEPIVFLVESKQGTSPLVVIDGHFLPDHPNKLLSEGNYKSKLNLLVSTVEDEASFFLTFMGLKKFRAQDPEAITLDEAKGILSLFAAAKSQSISTYLLFKAYFAGLTPHKEIDQQNEIRKRVGIAYGDALLGCPTLEFAKAAFWNAPETVKVYQWFYRAKLGKPKLLCNEWAGACHCDELYPLFGLPLSDPENYQNREREISSELISVIRAFIRTGTPGREQLEWEPYFTTNDGLDPVLPYYEIGDEPKSTTSLKFNLKQIECELIWNKYIKSDN